MKNYSLKALRSQNYFLRGTYEESFENRKNEGVYYGRFSDKKFITSTTWNMITAMIYGINRWEEHNLRNPRLEDKSRPLLLAISSNNYKIKRGLENDEVVFEGKIDLKDIYKIDNLPTFWNFCDLLGFNQKERIAHEKIFLKYFSKSPDFFEKTLSSIKFDPHVLF